MNWSVLLLIWVGSGYVAWRILETLIMREDDGMDADLRGGLISVCLFGGPLMLSAAIYAWAVTAWEERH